MSQNTFKDLPEDFLSSKFISINEIYSIGGYVPDIVFEALAKSSNAKNVLVNDINPSYNGKETVFEYLLKDHTPPSFEFTAPIKKAVEYSSFVATYDSKEKIYMLLQYNAPPHVAKNKFLDGDITGSTGWEEYESAAALSSAPKTHQIMGAPHTRALS